MLTAFFFWYSLNRTPSGKSSAADNGKPNEKDPKSAAGKRILSIGDDLLKVLKRERFNYFNSFATSDFKATGYVIHKDNGEPYNPDSITQKWERFCEKMISDIFVCTISDTAVLH